MIDVKPTLLPIDRPTGYYAFAQHLAVEARKHIGMGDGAADRLGAVADRR